MKLKDLIDNYEKYELTQKNLLQIWNKFKYIYNMDLIHFISILFFVAIFTLNFFLLSKVSFSIAVFLIIFNLLSPLFWFIFVNSLSNFKLKKIDNLHPLLMKLNESEHMLNNKKNNQINKHTHDKFENIDIESKKIVEFYNLLRNIREYKIKEKTKHLKGDEKNQAVNVARSKYKDDYFSMGTVFSYLLDKSTFDEFDSLDKEKLKSFLLTCNKEEQKKISEQIIIKIEANKIEKEKTEKASSFINSLSEPKINNKIIKEI